MWGAGRAVARLADAFWFVAVALCWGFTNPFIARGSKGVEAIAHPSPIVHKLLVARFLLTRWQYVVPLVLNLSGSAVYYATLSHAGTDRAGEGGARAGVGTQMKMNAGAWARTRKGVDARGVGARDVGKAARACVSLLKRETLLLHRSSDLSMASPVTNSLTFLFTALGGALLGEDVFTRRTF